jgi:hypothetical protein
MAQRELCSTVPHATEGLVCADKNGLIGSLDFSLPIRAVDNAMAVRLFHCSSFGISFQSVIAPR